jgi:SAM-dependent methyltransferase
MMAQAGEVDRIHERYDRRDPAWEARRDDPLNPANYLYRQEKERALIRWIKFARLEPLAGRRLLEVGCGGGGNLLQFLRLGFRPENLAGNDLREAAIAEAAAVLPASVQLLAGDASELEPQEQGFDVVFQSTVFTSILDDGFQQALADRMWALVRSDGGVLWYDFVYDNPANRDVRGVPVRRVAELFHAAPEMKVWRVGLAPPLRRAVARIHPAIYAALDALPLLRSHVLCWIPKPAPLPH